jgi:hypothetical protein
MSPRKIKKLALAGMSSVLLSMVAMPSAAYANDDFPDFEFDMSFDVGNLFLNRMPEQDPNRPFCDLDDGPVMCTLRSLFPYLFPPKWSKLPQCDRACMLDRQIRRLDREIADQRKKQGR